MKRLLHGLCLLSSALMLCHSLAQMPQALIIDEHQHLWQVEIAADSAHRQRGLMHRVWLAPWQGMLFIFPYPQESAFWMKNTLVALDIRFYDASGQALARYPNAQPCLQTPCPTYPSFGKALYVLETRNNSWIGGKIRIISLPENFMVR